MFVCVFVCVRVCSFVVNSSFCLLHLSVCVVCLIVRTFVCMLTCVRACACYCVSLPFFCGRVRVCFVVCLCACLFACF